MKTGRASWLCALALWVCSWSQGVWADEDRLAAIRFIEGSWQAERFLMDAEQNWVGTGTTPIAFERLYGMNFLQAKMQLPDLQWSIVLGRDPLNSRYRMASISADNGQLAVFEGQFSEKDGLILDNAVTDTAYQGPKGKYYLRYRFRAEEDGRVILTTFRAAARELEWRPVSRVVFTRR